MKNKAFFPLYVDLEGKLAVIVGGGRVATRRAAALSKFTRKIRVVAPKITPQLEEMVKTGAVAWVNRKCMRTDLSDAYMVLAATNDRRVNDDIYRICKKEGIYVNVASDKEKCDFYFPGIVKYKEMVIGINASGLDHSKARRVREAIEKVLIEEDL